MKTNKLCSGFLLGALLTSSVAFAQQTETVLASTEKPTQEATAVEEEKQDEGPAFTFSGSVDTYFHTTFGTTWAGGKAPGTSFANQPGFGLGMANLIASYAGEKVGFTADLVFGPRGKDAVFGNMYTGQGIVNQLYAYLKAGEKVTFNLGQFNTFVGYEVISPAVNFHYSTSYLFSWGPFNHTGLRADFDLGGGLIGKLAIMNPTDLVEFNPVNTYTAGLQLGYVNDTGGTWLNVLYGDQDGKLDEDDGLFDGDYSEGTTMQIDLTGSWNFGESFSLGLNGSYRTVSAGETYNGNDITSVDEDSRGFMGVALYPKLTLSESFGLGLRAEWFQITNGYLYYDDGSTVSPFAFGRDAEGTGSVIDVTLSANYKVGGLTIIPELRADLPSEDSYAKKDGTLADAMLSFNLATVYKF